jgi:hypothetical protein
MNKMNTSDIITRKPRRSFTLNALREKIQETVRNFGPDELAMSTPAEVTLKKWSQEGFFDEIATLEQACAISIERLRSRGNYFPGGRRPNRTTGQAPTITDQTDHAAPMPHDELSQHILGELRSLSTRMTAMESRLMQASSSPPMAERAERAESTNAGSLVRALEQIDNLRRHMSIRLDNEVQLVRQNATAATGKAEPTGDANTFMELQRMNMRLSRLTDLIQTGKE